MNKPQTPLTKTCARCGLQKPLSAFLQISGPQGATYGSICSACRKIDMESPPPKEHEESTRTDSGVKIDIKAKVKNAVDKREHLQQKEDLHEEEQEDKENLEQKKIETKENKQKAETQHRQDFLHRRSFLSTSSRVPTKPATTTAQQLNERAAQKAHGIDHTAKQEQAAKAEQREKEHDFTAPFVDTQISGKEKFTKGIAYKEFVTRAKPISRIFEQARAKVDQKGKIETVADDDEKDDLVDFVENKWGPNSRKP